MVIQTYSKSLSETCYTMNDSEIALLCSKFDNLDSALVTAIALDCPDEAEAVQMLEMLNNESVPEDEDLESCSGTTDTGNTGNTLFTSVDDFKEAQRLQMIENYHEAHERVRNEESERRQLREEIEDTDLNVDTYMTVRRMFPLIPRIKIRMRMKKFPENSVEDLMEYFLNYDTLKEVAPDEFNANVEALRRVQHKKKVIESNRHKRGVALVQLTPLQRIPYWDECSNTSEQSSENKQQCWDMFSSDIDTISELVSVQKHLVAKYYYAANVSVAKTILNLIGDMDLPSLSEQDTRYVYDSTEQFRRVPFFYLERLYLAVDRDDDRYRRVAEIIGRHDDNWSDLINFNFDGKTGEPDVPEREPLNPRVVLSAPVAVAAPSTNAKLVVMSAPAPINDEPEYYGPIVDDEGFTVVSGRSDARRKTVEELQQLAERFEATRKSYQQKSAANASLRGYYRGAMAELEEKRRQATTEARLLQQKQSESAYWTDLHGLTVQEAMVLVADKVDNWWKMEKIGYDKDGSIRALHIVTGAGNHSQNGVPKIKNSVSMWLKSHGWDFHRNHASLDVVGRRGAL